jgi:hypothetical protein
MIFADACLRQLYDVSGCMNYHIHEIREGFLFWARLFPGLL